MKLSSVRKIPFKKFLVIKKRVLLLTAKMSFWFFWGAVLGFFFFASFLFIFYQKMHTNRIYTGIYVNGVDFSGKTQSEVKAYFDRKNAHIAETKLVLTAPEGWATVSASQLGFWY